MMRSRLGTMTQILNLERRHRYPRYFIFADIKVSGMIHFLAGKVSTPGGWVDVSKVTFLPPNPTNKQTKRFKDEKPESGVASSKGPPGLAALFAAGPPGKGRGGPTMGKGRGGGLGDIFAGGMKPNAGALKGGSG